MSVIVVDASAVLAFLKNEPGSEKFGEVLGRVAISAVNLAEVAAVLSRTGLSEDNVGSVLSGLNLAVIVFDREQAIATGVLQGVGRRHGLSLGDRACLALAKAMQLPVLTTDRSWARLDMGVEVRLAR